MTLNEVILLLPPQPPLPTGKFFVFSLLPYSLLATALLLLHLS